MAMKKSKQPKRDKDKVRTVVDRLCALSPEHGERAMAILLSDPDDPEAMGAWLELVREIGDEDGATRPPRR
jgi:hypothetical protein